MSNKLGSVPNEKTIRALEDIEAGRVQAYVSVERLFEDLLRDEPHCHGDDDDV